MQRLRPLTSAVALLGAALFVSGTVVHADDAPDLPAANVITNPPGSIDAGTAAALLAEIRQLRETVKEQGARLDAVQGRVDEQEQGYRLISDYRAELADAADLAVADAMAQQRDTTPILALGKGIYGLKLTGDLRLRYEHDEDTTLGSDRSRDQWRVRLRLGGIWDAEGWEVGVGLKTGSSAGTSANQTYSSSSPFDSGNISLDYAYARHTWDDFRLAAGQQKNPFLGTWAVWDNDVRPVGLTLNYGAKEGPFVTVGGYNVRNYGRNEDNAYLAAVQAGWAGRINDQFSYKAALAWYHYTHATLDGNGAANAANNDYDYDLGQLYAELGYTVGDVKTTLRGELTKNFAADGSASQVSGMPAGTRPEDQSLEWLIGASVAYQKFELSYDYAHIEADSVYGQVNDVTFGGPFGTTDIEGHALSLTYTYNKNLSFTGTAYLVDPIERTNRDDGRVYIVDAQWKF